MTSYAISSLADIWDHISESTDVIAVDEVQFFDQEIVEVLSSLADKGYRVIATGLDMDFRESRSVSSRISWRLRKV